MAEFEVTRGSESYTVTVPDDQADGITPEALVAMIDRASAAPSAPRPVQLRVEGIPQPVRVDPSFRDLSPEEQGRTVDQIRAAWDARQRPTGVGLSALQHGLRQGAQGVGATARVLGDALDNDWLRRQGNTLTDAVPEPRGYVPSSPALVQAIRDGRFGDAAGHLPGAIAEAVPAMGATMAAGALGSAVGGPVGGLAAAGLASGAQTFGPVAEERAAHDGVAASDPENMLAAAGTTAASAALDAVGARGAGRALAAPRGVSGRVGAALHATRREGITEGAQQAVEQVGTSLGTRDGLQMDPAEIAAAAATGAGAGGMVRLPGAVVAGGADGASDALIPARWRDMDFDTAASVVRVNDLIERDHADVRWRTGEDMDLHDVARNARDRLATDLRGLIRGAERHDWLDQRDRQEGTTMRGLVEDAERPGNDIRLTIHRLDELSHAPAIFRDQMRLLLTDLDTLSHTLRPDQQGGPLERAGRIAGAGAGLAAGIHAGPVGTALAVLTAASGTSLGAHTGARVGRVADRVIGTGSPAVMRARKRAEAALAAGRVMRKPTKRGAWWE